MDHTDTVFAQIFLGGAGAVALEGVRQFARKQKPGALDLGDQPTQFGFQRVELVDELRAALADMAAKPGSDANEHRPRHVHSPAESGRAYVGNPDTNAHLVSH